jgi:ABC-type amino acid transport system permease subunit
MGDTPPPSNAPRVNFWKRHAPVLAQDVDTQRVEIFGLGLGALGALIVVFYSGVSKMTSSWLLAAAAFFALGMTIGFIFAIPRASGRYVNSNLELISDWLTKILVGVGLTQFKSIPSALSKLATFVAGGIKSSGQDQAFALFVILYFFFAGFVASYLETRVFLTGAFIRSEPQETPPLDKDSNLT